MWQCCAAVLAVAAVTVFAEAELAHLSPSEVPGSAQAYVSVVAGGGSGGPFSGNGLIATRAKLGAVRSITIDSSGNLYIADNVFGSNPIHSRCEIQVVRRKTGVIQVVAGEGFNGPSGTRPALRITFRSCGGLAVGTKGQVYVEDGSTGHIVRVSTATGAVSSYDIGGGALAMAPDGTLLFADGDRVRGITRLGTIISVAGTGKTGFSGDGGPASRAELNDVAGIAVDPKGNVYIADRGNHRIREVFERTRVIRTVVGGGVCRGGTPSYCGLGGVATRARILSPEGVAVDSRGNIYIAMGVVLEARRSSGRLYRIAGSGRIPLSQHDFNFQRESQPALQAKTDAAGVAVGPGDRVMFAEDNIGLVREIIEPPK